nr:ATP/GTP-binding protein [Hoyosella rhizosphaerae]
MPRRNSPRRDSPRRDKSSPRHGKASSSHRPLGLSGPRVATGTPVGFGSDSEFLVRQITGAAATKPYRCPGCDQVIGTGVAHVVAWPNRSGGTDERRHWHQGCWNKRSTRGVTRRWS